MRRPASRLPAALLILPALLGIGHGPPTCAETPGSPPAADWVLRGGLVIDGTGAPGQRVDVAIRGDRITAVGQGLPAGPETRVLDASNLVVAPGFIDLHTHSDGSILAERTRSNRNYLAQGVTTIVTGNCGSGPIDVADFLGKVDERGAGTNVIHLVPHGSVRRKVMGNSDQRADAEALASMEDLVEKGMQDGAWGMSTGLIYLPGRYADTAELVALSRVVARHGGIYASHIRGEGGTLLRAIDEAITIGRESGAPVHISHLKASGRANWGRIQDACRQIAEARQDGQVVTADQYPYIASSTSLGAMVVPHWALQEGTSGFVKLVDDPETASKLRATIEELLTERNGGSSIRIARYNPKPAWVGRDLKAIGETEGMDVTDVVIEIQRNGGAQAISFAMSEDDVRYAMQQPFVATASDGSAHAPGGTTRPHPRSYGTFPRKVRYALDEEVLSLEAAIHSASGLPAEVLGLLDRGTIRPGAFADLVVFDPEQFRDSATFDDPTQYAPGVVHLFVNGVATIMNGEYKDALAGRALRRTEDGPADRILKVGRIWTGDPARPWAEALAVRGGQLVAVGTADEVLRFRGPRTEVIDRPDAFAVPGLIDAHGHLTMLGSTVDQIDLRGVESPEAVARLVRERIDATPGEGWVLGRNWDQSLWPGNEFPTAAVLDAVAPDRPVWLVRVDGHAGWANSEALRRAGLEDEAKIEDDPEGDGRVLRDGSGRPTGVFIDDAMNLVTRSIPAPSRETIARHILAAQEQALAVGLTGVHDAGLPRGKIEVYRELDAEGKLKLRVYGMASPPGGGEVGFIGEPPPSVSSGGRFTLRAIKLFADGAMGSRGGLLFEPYSDDPGNVGLRLIDPEDLTRLTVAALKSGWQVCTHAIGDRANAEVLDAYAAALREVPEAEDPRLRIEHAQVVRREDVSRFKKLGVIASMQPAHASTDKRWADARLGEDSDRVAGAYAWSWFRDAGVTLAFGSDFPVEVVSPFWGLYAAITRRDEQGEPAVGWHPEHILSLEDALRAHTSGSAHAGFAEDRLGTLRPGLRADVTVVDRDLFKATPEEILHAVVELTVIDGEVVYQRDTAASGR